MNLVSMGDWTVTNWVTVLAVVAWGVANVLPRPHPETLTGGWKVFWLVIDRLCILTAAKVPGDFKWIFAPSPAPEPPGKLPPMVPPPSPPPTL